MLGLFPHLPQVRVSEYQRRHPVFWESRPASYRLVNFFCAPGCRLLIISLGPLMISAPHSFQTTRWTNLLRLREGVDAQERDLILSQLCRAYWFPLYGYARRSGRAPQDAEDLTQGFFERALANDLFAKANRDSGKMRTFLLTAFQRFMRDEHEKAAAEKRGGGQRALSFDAMEAEERYQCEPQNLATPEDLYNRRWARDFFATITERLRLEYSTAGKGKAFEAVRPWLLQEGSAAEYGPDAASIGVTEGNFRVMIVRYRKRYRELFREAVADTLDSPSAEEIEQEIRELIRLGSR